MPLNFRAILSRINGIATPIGGINWNPPKPEVKIVKELFVFLEDRRFLYTPFESEDHNYVVQSVLQTRERLSQSIQEDRDSVLVQGTIAMRAACRTFLDRVGTSSSHAIQLGFSYVLALGELRAQFGFSIARIALAYAVNVPDSLIGILPPQTKREDKK